MNSSEKVTDHVDIMKDHRKLCTKQIFSIDFFILFYYYI